MCHVFPGLTPFNMYDLQIRHYLNFTAAIDARRRDMKEQANG